jgi:glutamyl-tRNA reductase
MKMKDNEEKPYIGLVGLNHKIADVSLRECFSFKESELDNFYKEIMDSEILESVYISTCNRVEIYFASANLKGSGDKIKSVLRKYTDISDDQFDVSFYVKDSKDAVTHLLTVISSLDSMVLGENEIVGQIKTNYTYAVEKQYTKLLLNKLFHQAFRTSKQVRTETDISKNPLSMAYIAVELIKKIFKDMKSHTALLIGAGEMGELILKYLTKENIGKIIIANRSKQNAKNIADKCNENAEIISVEEIDRAAENVDIIIASAGAPHFIISEEITPSIMKDRMNKPLFMIDIAVPRDIDPEVEKYDGIHLYNIDDLKSIADENLQNKLNEVKLAEEYIEKNVVDFFENLHEESDVTSTIVSLQNKFEEIRMSELKRYRRKKLKYLSDNDFKLVEDLTNQIMTKTLHNPIINLKQHHKNKDVEPSGERLKRKTKFVEELFIK